MKLKNLEELDLNGLYVYIYNVIKFRLYVEDNGMTLKILNLNRYTCGFAFVKCSF